MNCNCNNNRIMPAVITPVLAAGSTTSPYFVAVNILQRLCRKTCADKTPVFNPQFSLKSIANVGTGQYMITMHVEGIISYVPCGGGCCDAQQQPLSQDFTFPLSSSTAPTSVTVEQGSTINSISRTACQKCSRTFVSETPLTITVA